MVSRLRDEAASRESADASVSALYRASDTAVQNLREALGDHGCEALLGRAFATLELRHPVVTELRDPHTFTRERLAIAVQAHGEPAVEAAVEGFISVLIEILGRLIGEDMAIRLIDPDAPREPHDAAGTS
jgi:hypothetical protein